MKAIYCKDQEFNRDEFIVEGSQAHHLMNVMRSKVGDEILFLNGKGFEVFSTIISMDKKKVVLKKEELVIKNKEVKIDLLVGLPKKEAFEKIIKMSVELGVSHLIPLKSEYSQLKILPYDRLNRLVESAIIQSNNPFELKIEELKNFTEFFDICSQYDHVFYFCSKKSAPYIFKEKFNSEKKILLIIGPEGGFSNKEEDIFGKISNIQFLNLQTNILRSPTALPAAFGHILAFYTQALSNT